MSIEQAINDRLRTYRPLVDAIGAARFAVGALTGLDDAARPPLPYVTLERRGRERYQRLSGGRYLLTSTVRFNIWAGTLAASKHITGQLVARFDRCACRGGDVLVQDMKRIATRESIRPDASWHTAVDFQVRAELRS